MRNVRPVVQSVSRALTTLKDAGTARPLIPQTASCLSCRTNKLLTAGAEQREKVKEVLQDALQDGSLRVEFTIKVVLPHIPVVRASDAGYA